MNILTVSDIATLKAMPKKLMNPRARKKPHERYIAVDYDVEGPNGEKFHIYTRQNLLDEDDFSTGLRWSRPGADVSLVRYNGSSHPHRNAIEGETLSFVCHIHEPTERYQAADKKGDGFATVTDRYGSLAGAFELLLTHWNISRPASSVSSSGAQQDLLE